jgi:glutamine cyclotransferase
MENASRKRNMGFATIIILIAILLFSYQTIPQIGVVHYSVNVVNKYHHSVSAFTQGLVYNNGLLYESTGIYGQSIIKVTEFPSERILMRITLPETYFGEGLTLLGDNLYQITWKENAGFVYNLDLEEVRSFTYHGEGWGLTSDDVHLIMSNGSSTISYHDPDTFEIIRTIDVVYDGNPVHNLNELEHLNGVIYANIWHQDQVVMIDSEDGAVVGWVEMGSLRNFLDPHGEIDVLNGIAYNPDNDTFYVTGKLWPNIFEVELVPK